MDTKAMKIVNGHCSSQMEIYAKCIERYPNQWNTACSLQRHELARCSETHPAMMKVKAKCDSVFRKYEECQKSHPNNHKRCKNGFEKFLHCVDLVAGTHVE